MDEPFDPAHHFDADKARGYDAGVASVIPGYALFHRLTRLLLERMLGPRAQVLVAGTGTGTEIVALGGANPDWRFTGIDPAPEMAAVARRRIAEAGLTERAEVRLGWVEDLDTDDRFDAATLLLVLQFVQAEDAKEELLTAIARRLKPGAPLVLVDLHGDPQEPAFARLADAWRAWQFDAGLDPSVIEDTFRHVLKDIQFLPEARIAAHLTRAGFTTVTPFFRALLFGGWVAFKAP